VAGVELIRVSKRFGDLAVLEDVTLDIKPLEFVAFLGPSGCGKSTLLRIIAGLEYLDDGEVRIGAERVDHLAPGKRGVAMVFQHYALYPHMTIRENMAFGLKNVGVAKDEIDSRIAEAARILEIEPLLDQKPGQLSGGQRQRVAIGRAIVKHPKLFLFDEPLSNLDAALRARTRIELAQLRRRVEATMILVTHDQVEAMTLADRIVVMNDRVIQQVGTPMEIYERPANLFVAGFVGTPKMNVAPVTLAAGPGADAVVTLGDGTSIETGVARTDLPKDGALRIGLRAEAIGVVAEGKGDAAATVEFVERLGDRTLVYLKLADGSEFVAEDEGTSQVAMGDRVGVTFDGAQAHLFDEETRGYHAQKGAA